MCLREREREEEEKGERGRIRRIKVVWMGVRI
jgi:hypothetical protein